jgi:hypothetical protein
MPEKNIRWQVCEKYFDKIEIEDAKFIYEHAEKQLQDGIDTSAIITARTTTLLTVVVAIFTAVIGFIISKLNDCTKIDDLLITSILSIIYLFIICLKLKKNIKGVENQVVGAPPQSFFTESFYGEGIDKNQKLIRLYVNEFESYQVRLEKNK